MLVGGLDTMDFATVHATFKAAGVKIEPGLSVEEFAGLERRYGFQFPPDLREFLALGLPVSDRWVDWRNGDPDLIRGRLDEPVEGICFDIEHNEFWLPEWSDRPADLSEAFAIARRAVAAAPVLIPIYAHRYLPAVPAKSGNPVFSVHQTDIIHYGSDLLDYLRREFHPYFGGAEPAAIGECRPIPFWSQLVS
jgi:hypothetical protein